ncbi:MAG TPA: type II toxin-antitoxin system PemK/MazF family toxin [Thermoanaerobaculia bacterium]|nr:type II toxin-antitoxin system PemK/MazF family toxin [Thermoanaerobaculia bacterium]
MRRGDLYRVFRASTRDPKSSRVYVIVSRQLLVDSVYSSVICAPIYSSYRGLATQVLVGIEEGLKHESSIHCDDLQSLPKSVLTNFVGSLPPRKMRALNHALRIALELPG